MRFGTVPSEVPVQRAVDLLAPAFRDALRAALADVDGGRPEQPFETGRTEERQTFLYGFGRDYDDGRGVVTHAASALYSWHGFWLACDVVEKDGTPWDAPPSFWTDLGAAGEAHGLTWGGRWKKPDLPHLQWGACPVSPSDADRALFNAEGKEAVWTKYGAI